MLLRKTQKGFTLIEAVVAASLFAVSVVAIIGVYLNIIRINRKTDFTRIVSENARYISEYMSKEIRNGTIDYYTAFSPCSSIPSSSGYTLAIVNVDKDRMCFYLGDNVGLASATGTNLWVIKNNILPAVKVNSNNVTVNNLTFYVYPNFNPYTAGSNVEPGVTITAQIKSISLNQQDIITIPIQTAVSLPLYDIQ